MTYPDFFAGRKDYWTFEEVVAYIHKYFVVTPVPFSVLDKHNSVEENQRACCVLAYAKLMGYTFNQTKALFGEHDHLAIALPELKKTRNIYQLNILYTQLLQQGKETDIRIKDFPAQIVIPEECLVLK